MPDFLQGVEEVPEGEYEASYIDPRYYSAFAIRWAEKAHEYIRDGYHLKPEDGELLCRIDMVRACTLPADMRPSDLAPSKNSIRQVRNAEECRQMWMAMWEEWERRYQKWLGEQSRKWWAENREARPGAYSPYSRYIEGDSIDDDFDLTPLRAYKDMRMREAGMSDDAVDKEIARSEGHHAAIFGVKATRLRQAHVRREVFVDDDAAQGTH